MQLLPVLATAAGSAGTAAAAAGTAAAGASTFGTILSVGLTAASAFGQIMAGQQQAAVSRFQAQQSAMQAKLEGLKGREQALQIRQQLERDLAGANAAFAARGLRQEGSALAAIQAGKERAQQDLDAARFGAANAQDAAMQQSAQLRAQARSQRMSGFIGAATTIGQNRIFRSLID